MTCEKVYNGAGSYKEKMVRGTNIFTLVVLFLAFASFVSAADVVFESGNFSVGGSVGIGTASPNVALTVSSTDAAYQARLLQETDADGSDVGMLFQISGVEEYIIGIDSGDSNKFKISDSALFGTNDRLTIDTSGNIGIGTTSPGAPLEVVGTAPQIQLRAGATTSRIRLQASSTANFFEFWKDSTPTKAIAVGMTNPGVGALEDDIIFSTYNGVSWSERVRINNSNGYFGIGTKSPTYPLEVHGNVTGISIWSDGNISAAGYITRTSVWDTAQFGNALDWIRDSDDIKQNGVINHSKMSPHVVKHMIMVQVGENTLDVFDEKTNQTTSVTTPVYEEREVEGVLLDDLVAKYEQAIWELSRENKRLEQEMVNLLGRVEVLEG